MNAQLLVRKAKRSVANSKRQITKLLARRQKYAPRVYAAPSESAKHSRLDRLISLAIKHVDRRETRRIERRLKHHEANIAKLQTFAVIDREQAEGLIAWLDSARADRRAIPDADILALTNALPLADVRRPTRYESILKRLGFGNGVAA